MGVLNDGFDLENGDEVNLPSGTWDIHANFQGAGSAKLMVSKAGGAFTDIEDASWVDTDVNIGGILTVGDVRVRADTTGGAVIVINKVNNR